MEKTKDYSPLLKRIIDSLQSLIKINNEHKEIGKKMLDGSMSLKEQRVWTIAQIILIILVGGGVFLFLKDIFYNEETTIQDYAIDISVDPNKIMLNQESDQNFKFTFTNVGTKNITNFEVVGIELYRLEENKLRMYRQLVTFYDLGKTYLNCGLFHSNDDFIEVGKKCTLESKMYSCKECFDDKDKPIMFFIYLKSTPPIDNKIINLTIF